MRLDERGQAYSTFKLLIAAIVAMAILGILIPIIMSVIGLIKNNPTDESVKLLNELVGKPGTIKYASDVSFDTANPTLSGSTLANKTELSKDQICMSLGSFANDPDFVLQSRPDQHVIQYKGTSGRTVDIAIVCNVDWTELEGDLDFYMVRNTPLADLGDTSSTCESFFTSSGADAGTVCVLVLVRAT